MATAGRTIKLTDNIYAIHTRFLLKTSLLRTHSFLIASEENELLLIDTGGPGSGEIILNEIEKIGLSPQNIKGIALSHWHGDHSGSVKEIIDSVYNGSEKIKLFIGKKDLPLLKRKGPGLVKINPAIKLHILHSPGKLPNEEKVEIIPLDIKNETNPLEKWGIDFIPTPGHTPGHTAYYHKKTESLFSGCALSMLGKRVAGIVPVYWNRSLQIESAKKLSAMNFRYLFPVHIKINSKEIPLLERIPFSGKLPLPMRLIGSIPFFSYPREDCLTGKEK